MLPRPFLPSGSTFAAPSCASFRRASFDAVRRRLTRSASAQVILLTALSGIALTSAPGCAGDDHPPAAELGSAPPGVLPGGSSGARGGTATDGEARRAAPGAEKNGCAEHSRKPRRGRWRHGHDASACDGRRLRARHRDGAKRRRRHLRCDRRGRGRTRRWNRKHSGCAPRRLIGRRRHARRHRPRERRNTRRSGPWRLRKRKSRLRRRRGLEHCGFARARPDETVRANHHRRRVVTASRGRPAQPQSPSNTAR